MKIKTKEEILKDVESYLTKTAKHLFVINNGDFYKIETLKVDNKLYYVTILINNEIYVDVKEAVSDRRYATSRNITLNMIKLELFQKYNKSKSIPYFKKMRLLIKDLLKEIKLDNSLNKELASKFSTNLEGFQKI